PIWSSCMMVTENLHKTIFRIAIQKLSFEWGFEISNKISSLKRLAQQLTDKKRIWDFISFRSVSEIRWILSITSGLIDRYLFKHLSLALLSEYQIINGCNDSLFTTMLRTFMLGALDAQKCVQR
ncbi:hypothetical protein ACJX0J_040499, partial [Zea mays]